MSSAAKGGGSSRRLNVAGRRYVAAKGGSKKASSGATSGRTVTAGIGAFVSDIASRGIAEATQALGLVDAVGKEVSVVLSAVIDAIAPQGSTDENAIARRAATETLRELFQKYGVEETGLDSLNAMSPASVAETIELSVSAYVYHRWLLDLSQKIEEHSVSEAAAVRLERDVKAFVRGLVKLKLSGNQAIRLNWKGTEGRTFVEKIYEAAYALLGGTQ